MNTINVENCKTLLIGRRGENEVTTVAFDFTEWASEFGSGVVDLYVKRFGDNSAYPVVLTIDGTIATWTVTATDTNVAGYGKAEYVYRVDGKIAKSAVFPFFVAEDIGQPASEPPDPYESWLEQLTALGAETEAHAQAAEQSAENAAESAEDAAQSAASAEGYAGQAETAAGLAQAAQTASEAARDAAQTAQASAESSATAASGSAASAAGSATAAAGSASDASSSASDASDSAIAAGDAETQAEAAKTAAQAAQSAAEDAAEDAQQAAQQAHVEYEQLSGEVDDLSDEVSQQKSAIGEYKGFEAFDNILPIDSTDPAVVRGITWQRTNGTYTFDGTSTGTVQITLIGGTSIIPDGLIPGETYYVDSGVQGTNLQLRIYGTQNGTSSELARFTKFGSQYAPSGLWTVPQGYDGFLFRWYLASGNTLSNFTVTPIVSRWFSNKKLTDSIFSQARIDFPIDGYVNVADGKILPAQAEYKEVASYPIYGVQEFQIRVSFAASRNHSLVISCYDINNTFLGSTTLSGSSTDAVERFFNVKWLYPQFYYFRLHFRTFGESYTCEFIPVANSANLAVELSKTKYESDAVFQKSTVIDANVTRSTLGSSLFRFDKYWDHLFSDGANGQNVKVPWESLIHVRLSKRLGFQCIEANVHELADGNYLVMHGSTTPGYEAFGNSVQHINGTTDISSLAFADVTLAWVKQNVRYKCDVPKYRVAPPSLQEFLDECKSLGMIPLVQAVSSDFSTLKPELDIINEIMGKDNFILYVRPDGGNEEIREYTSAPLSRWGSLATEDEIIAWVKQYHPCYYGMSNYADFTDEELRSIVENVHAEGGLIGSAYVSEANRLRLINLGFDYFAAKYNINDFGSGNLCNLTADLAFADFATTGTVSYNILNLGVGDTVSPSETIPSAYLSGAILGLVFIGTISVNFGEFINAVEITSDGSKEVVLSTYFLNSTPTFEITATAQTNVEMITFKASKF